MDILNLQNWKFSLDKRPDLKAESRIDPWAPGFDDSSWQDVIVPHDWAVSFPFSRDNSSGTGYLPGGTGWYRTVFSAGPGEERRAFVNFDGVYKNSQVWCNGYYLGSRPSGYASFRYDISHCIHKGDDNVIAVKVSHEDIADSRWYSGSGIYRKVFIQFHDAVFIRSESLVIQSDVQNNEAIITISGEALNSGKEKAEGLLVRAIINGGEDYTSGEALPTLENGASVSFTIKAIIPSPRLWSAKTPNLYRLSLELSANAGGRNCLHKVPPVNIGIRSIRFDPDKGFFINGENEKLKGVCVHHDAGCLGAAVWPDVWRRRLGKLKEMGCNAVRTSHNPHMPELYDLCDEMGFYVMEEAFDEWEGCKNKWVRGHNVYPPAHQGYYEDFPQWHERDLTDMVIRGRNHPSIIMWSIGNEIDYPNDPYAHPLFNEMTGNNDANKPKKEREYDPKKPNMERLSVIAAELVKIVKKHDTSRPVLTAAAFPELSSQIGFFDSLDMVGYNYKEQFYEGDHKRFPCLPILGSENGHHLNAWKAVKDNDYISGQFLWTGIDYLGEARGWPIRGSGAGLLDLGGFEKIGYFRRKALWNEKPQVYLASRPALENDGTTKEISPWELYRSWNYKGGAPVAVVCYTNCESVELFLNGKSLGTKRREEDADYLAWTVPFERGKLEAKAPDAVDVLESTLSAVQFRLYRWENIDSEATLGAYKLYQVELELLDENDRPCTTESILVHFSLSGEGKILGIENGDLADCTEYSAAWRRVYRGRLIVYVLTKTKEANDGPIILTAAAEGFASEEVSLGDGPIGIIPV